MCTKMILQSHHGGYSPLGRRNKVQCQKQEYKAGLCYQHYKRSIEKATPYGERPGYKDATEKEMLAGYSMKMKHSAQHEIYRFRNGMIQKYHSKTEQWLNTDLDVDHTPFCIKHI